MLGVGVGGAKPARSMTVFAGLQGWGQRAADSHRSLWGRLLIAQSPHILHDSDGFFKPPRGDRGTPYPAGEASRLVRP